MTEATSTALGRFKLLCKNKLSSDNRGYNNLCDPHQRSHNKVGNSMINETNSYISAIIAINCSWCIENSNAKFCCKTTSRAYLYFISPWNFHFKSGRNKLDRAWLNDNFFVNTSKYICPSSAF